MASMKATLDMLYRSDSCTFLIYIIESDGSEYCQKHNLSEAEACAVATYFTLNQGAYHPLMKKVKDE